MFCKNCSLKLPPLLSLHDAQLQVERTGQKQRATINHRGGLPLIKTLGVLMFASIRSAFLRWWEGELLLPSIEEIFEEDRPDKYKRHWSSSLAHVIVPFWLSHWKVLLPIIIGAIVALFIHFDSKSSRESKKEETKKIGVVAIIHGRHP